MVWNDGLEVAESVAVGAMSELYIWRLGRGRSRMEGNVSSCTTRTTNGIAVDKKKASTPL